MKIIKRGVVPENIPIQEKCSKCNTLFEYTQKDVQIDSRDGDYVICPVCKVFIGAKSPLKR